MNVPTTSAAEGLPRRAFSIAEVETLVAAGVIGHDERVELIGGELVPMVPKSTAHETIKILLNQWLCLNADDAMWVAVHTTFRLSDYTYLEPDFVLFPRSVGFRRLNGRNADLVIEIGDESLEFDLGRKAKLYATFGVKELWVIDAQTRRTTRFRQPSEQGYQDIERTEEGEVLQASFIPSICLSLSNLDRPE